MSKYWPNLGAKTFQETVGKTVVGLSDSAARLKQGWGETKQASPEPSSQGSPRTHSSSPDKQQYLRLPLESARKLRWYDREDLSNLIQANLKDKSLLHSTIAALRQVLQNQGLAEDELEEDLQERLGDVDRLGFYDEGVATVLLASAQGEVENLKAENAAQHAELRHLRERLEGQGASHATPATPHVHLHIMVKEEAPPVTHMPAVPNLPLSTSAGIAAQGDEADGPSTPRLADGTESGGMAALLGKLRRVEGERLEYVEEIARLTDKAGVLERTQAEAEETMRSLRGELAASQAALARAEEAAERQLAELRARVAATQWQHTEMLRKAQDICVEAEDRAAALERRVDKAELRAVKAENEAKEARAEAKRAAADLKAKEKERDRAEVRATAAEASLAEAKHKGDAEKGGALTNALNAARKTADERENELRKAMREGEARLRERIKGLERDCEELRHSLARSQAEGEVLEARVVEGEEREAQLQSELRAAEAAVADRDGLAVRLAALEERLKETRAEQGQLANYKQIAKELETDRIRVEEEVLATARIATQLEGRLQALHEAKEAAERALFASEMRAAEAWRQVEKEVSRRLEAIGADETQWPRAAREEAARLGKKVEALHSMLNSLHAELDTESHALAAEQAARASVQVRLNAAEERASRLEWEHQDAATKAMRQLAEARSEVEEWRREAAALEVERDRLLHQHPGRPQHTLSTGSYASTPRRAGGGGLPGLVDMNGADSNGHMVTKDQLAAVDVLYLKNVVLRFLDAVANGRFEQGEMLLPAIATLLRASPQEFKLLKTGLHHGWNAASWWPKTQ